MEPKGYVSMPLYSNISVGLDSWTLTNCPECGEDCWDRRNDIVEELLSMGYVKVCTRCMLLSGNK